MFILAVLSLSLCACGEQKAVVLFNSQPITTKTVHNPETTFAPGQKINFVVLNKKGFEDKVIKVNVIKKDEKSEYWGYAPLMSKEFEVKNPNFYIDYFIIHQSGFYIMQVFELKNLQKPIGYGNFWVR